MPKVSIMVPAYQHEAYVAEALSSILNQNYQNFEVIVSDDCSTDGTVSEVLKFKDPRIKLHIFEKNVGATRNHEYCWENCSGEYIALLNSDDVWLPNHLEKSVAYLDKHAECGAVFSWCAFIDESSKTIDPNAQIFRQPNRTRAQWLQHFFVHGNCLAHPSMVIRSSVYEKIGFYSRTLRQLPDFDEWIRLVKHYEIHILQEVTVQHRRCNVQMANTSSPTLTNSIRDVAESQYILSHFFDDIEDGFFVEAFSGQFRNKDARTPNELLCEKFFLLLDDKYYMKRISIPVAFFYFHGINRIEGITELLERKYKYTINDFFELSGKMDILGLSQNQLNMTTNMMNGNQNNLKNRLKALAWAVFGKDSKMYNKMQKTFGKHM